MRKYLILLSFLDQYEVFHGGAFDSIAEAHDEYLSCLVVARLFAGELDDVVAYEGIAAGGHALLDAAELAVIGEGLGHQLARHVPR